MSWGPERKCLHRLVSSTVVQMRRGFEWHLGRKQYLWREGTNALSDLLPALDVASQDENNIIPTLFGITELTVANECMIMLVKG